MWAFGRHQSLYNHAMLEAVGEIANAVESIRTSVTEQVGHEVGSMRSQVGALEVDVRTMSGHLQATARQIDDLQARIDDLVRRLGAVDAPAPGARTQPD
jgi:septal ring factor EnvC (AmiA/AmiB activator)